MCTCALVGPWESDGCEPRRLGWLRPPSGSPGHVHRRVVPVGRDGRYGSVPSSLDGVLHRSGTDDLKEESSGPDGSDVGDESAAGPDWGRGPYLVVEFPRTGRPGGETTGGGRGDGGTRVERNRKDGEDRGE